MNPAPVESNKSAARLEELITTYLLIKARTLLGGRRLKMFSTESLI